jgi:hypothetical protein
MELGLRVLVPVLLLALATWSCGAGGTYCQSGKKMGTNCYSLSDVRTPPGTRPAPAGEATFWNQAPPNQGTFGAPKAPAPQPTSTTGMVPMSSPAWRPTLPSDAGTDSGQ